MVFQHINFGVNNYYNKMQIIKPKTDTVKETLKGEIEKFPPVEMVIWRYR